MTTDKEIFKTLNAIDVSEYTKQKTKLTYLPWAFAWTELLKVFPLTTYEVLKFENNLPYVYDPNTGYMVFTRITIEGLTKEMFLPVMNSGMKAMKGERYKYKTKYSGEKIVEKATMMEINKTIQRCLVKNIAIFGLGFYIYAGEDLPEEEPKDDPKKPTNKDKLKDVVGDLNQEAYKQIEARKKAISTYSILLDFKKPKNQADMLKTFKTKNISEMRILYKQLQES